jgi:DNA-binding beta-propeller fold protein YncE
MAGRGAGIIASRTGQRECGVKTSCPHCGAQVEVPSGASVVLCPNCHKPVHSIAEARTVHSPAEERTLTRPGRPPAPEPDATGPTLTPAPEQAAGSRRSTSDESRTVHGVEWMREHFGEKYEVIEFVKSGGMGAIYRARERRPSRIVAMKVLLGGHFATATQVKRFEREAQAVALLQHPAVVPVYEYGEVDGQPYFTMEFVDGADLRTYVLGNGLGRREVCELMATVCEAIQYAHEQGVVHRDLKPGNILVDASGRPRILDFGLSRAPSDEDGEEKRLTLTGEYLGTPRYMSPEQAMGQPKRVDERTDVFALGVILYELLVGALPYPIENVRGLKLIEVLTTWEPLRPGALRADFPHDLELILQKAVARDKNERYDSARALGEDLENYLAGRPISARPATLEYLLTRWMWRHRAVLAAAGVGALLLLAASGYFLYRIGREAAARRSIERTAQQYEGRAQRYLESFRSGRQAVDQAVADGDWQSAYTVAALAPNFWHGEPGVDALARKVRRAAEQLTASELAACAASVQAQDYAKARRQAADLAALAPRMPYEDLKGRLAAAEPGFAEACWQALKASLDAAYTPQQVRTRAETYLTAFAGGPHAPEASALEAELSARPAGYFQRRREEAFDRAMDERRWQDAQAVLDSSYPMQQDRLEGMRARLEAIIRPATAGDLKPLARLDAGAIVYGLDYSPDGKLLAVASGGRPIQLWDPQTGRSAQELPQEAVLRAMAFSPDGRRLAAGAEDGTVEVWSLAGGKLEHVLSGLSGRVRSLAFTPDGKGLLAADRGAALVYDLADGRPADLHGVNGTAPAALSPDGTLVAVATGGGAVGLYELSTGLPVQALKAGTEPVVMAFSPDGALLATGHTEAAGRRVRIWRVQDGALLTDIAARVGSETVYEKLSWALAFSPDGALLATADVDKEVKLWDVAGGRAAGKVSCASTPRALAFSPDSRSLAAGLNEGAVEVLGVH